MGRKAYCNIDKLSSPSSKKLVFNDLVNPTGHPPVAGASLQRER